MRITNCRVNHLTNPLGYFLEGTTFSWVTEGAAGTAQTAARIIVKRGALVAADTGWAALDSLAAPVDVELLPRTAYTWTVSVRTDAEEEATSDENRFETGKMDEAWTAKWIGCDDTEARHPVFTKRLVPGAPVESARLYIAGLGLYEAAWNGVKIGNERLTPYCNDYSSYIQYQTFDITEQMKTAGELSVTLGNGWYKGRFGFRKRDEPYYGNSWALIAEVHITYADGTEDVIGTDESWTVTRSNITFSNIYDGEQVDDTLPALPEAPARLTDAPKGKLTARYSTPVTVREELPVREVIHTKTGDTVLDIGQEITGGFRLKCAAPAGTKIHLQFGEILQGGEFYRNNLRTAKAEYIYVSDGVPRTLEPKFTFFGYRYVKVAGLPDIKAEDFTALSMYSDIPKTGSLSTGSPLINKLISNAEWSHKDNFLDVPTDCPQRDERMGWTGDAQIFSATACYLRDCAAFFNKYIWDISSEQKALGGMVPDVVPSFGLHQYSAAWGDVACVIPWTLYRYYGDITVLRAQYPVMKAWVEFLRSVDGDDHNWRKQIHYGDWLALDIWNGDDRHGGTDVGFVADVMYLRCVRLTAKCAETLGETSDAAEYNALSKKLLEYIRSEYFTPTGRCAVPTQTGLLLSLQYGLGTDKKALSDALLFAIQKSGNKIQTGFVGTPLLCPILTDIGRSDIAFEFLLNEDYPGWLYEVKMGATTIWERWNSVGPDGKIAENGMNSLNHYAYGSILEWLYKDVAGLSAAEPGFRRAKLCPHVNASLGAVELEYRSAAGLWKCGWRVLDNGDVTYRCTVPFGCTAHLELPLGGGSYELTPGEHEYTYTPDTPLRGRFSTKIPLKDLLANNRAKAVLVSFFPKIGQTPASMTVRSLRELTQAGRIGSAVTDEMLDKIDSALKDL